MIKHTMTWLLVLVALTACGGDDDSGPKLQAPPTSNPAAATSTPDAAPAADVARPDDGALLLARGADLVLYSFPAPEGGEPALIAENVATDNLAFTPERDAVVFAGPAGDRFEGLYLLDLATGESTLLFDLSETFVSFWSLRAWSPDGQWALIDLPSRGLAAVRRDGAAQHVIAGSNMMDAQWLTDGRVLLLDADFEAGPDNVYYPVYQGAAVFDPATGTQTPVELNLDDLNADPAQLTAQLAAQGIERASDGVPPEEPPYPGISGPNGLYNPQAGGLCDEWRVVLYDFVDGLPVEEPIAVFHDVYRLMELTPLEDDGWLVLVVRVPGCSLDGSPVGALTHVAPGAEPSAWADDVYAGVGLGQSSFFGADHFFAVSPDGRWAAWVSGGLTSDATSVHLRDLSTGESAPLYTEALMRQSSGAYVGDALLGSVYWVAPRRGDQ